MAFAGICPRRSIPGSGTLSPGAKTQPNLSTLGSPAGFNAACSSKSFLLVLPASDADDEILLRKIAQPRIAGVKVQELAATQIFDELVNGRIHGARRALSHKRHALLTRRFHQQRINHVGHQLGERLAAVRRQIRRDGGVGQPLGSDEKIWRYVSAVDRGR
jgi:hypothetical protein